MNLRLEVTVAHYHPSPFPNPLCATVAGQINKGEKDKKEQEKSKVKSSYKRCSVKLKKTGEKEERGEEESQEGMDSHSKQM